MEHDPKGKISADDDNVDDDNDDGLHIPTDGLIEVIRAASLTAVFTGRRIIVGSR